MVHVAAGGSVKAGDTIITSNGKYIVRGKIVRFYANHGTVLVEQEDGKLRYVHYENLDKV